VKDPRVLREDLARFLRQRRELGVEDFVLEGLTREEVLRAVSVPPGGGDRAPEPAGGAMAREGGPTSASPGAAGGAAPEVSRIRRVSGEPEGYDELRREALGCHRCPLAETRTKVVLSDGNPGGRVMVVGEAPGAHEDRTGRAFVGPAGKLLDLLLASVGLSREESVYICNVLKCRPPGNRNPLPEEIEACTPFLRRQIELVAPEAILAAGTFSARFLTGKEASLGKLRGSVYSYQGVPVVVTYHPAALLRNPGWTRATWADLQLLRQVIDGI